ncbi:hypothetical protein FPRO04_09038 [Fusarium proliferatum]|nr:hypothetical protein FPRO04_09038 [Fusarium proliferatum]
MTPPTPPRKILMVVTVGGYTHAAPVPEIGKVLAQRGHVVDFATLEGQESWTMGYEYISQLHLMGHGPSHEDLEAYYLRMQDSKQTQLPCIDQFVLWLGGVKGYTAIVIYLTHGGGSSANEGLYHRKPMLAIGSFFDQISNVPRLVASGTSEALDKFRFTPEEVCQKIKLLSEDIDGLYKRNCTRMQRIARAASRRKELGTDLIEEVMYDTEGRFDGEKELRPMHLQTADMRMSTFKARNWDLWLVGLVTLGVVPLASITVGK